MNPQKIAAQTALLDSPSPDRLARHIITFDPRQSSDYVFSAFAKAPQGPPKPIPWPTGLVPAFASMNPAPTPDDPLPHVDALVVTWTVAEAHALADVLTPGHSTSTWNVYRRDFDTKYKPVLQHGAPALQSNRLGLYAVCSIGSHTVLCMKSELHLSTDGLKLPIRMLWKQILDECQPNLVITTGTAGGIGAGASLGDVVVAKSLRFDCQKTFKNEPFARRRFTDTHPLGATSSQFPIAQQTLIPVNAGNLPAAPRTPQVDIGTTSSPLDVVTTDFFAFDDTTDNYGLRAFDAQGRAVEMDDAVLGLVATEDMATAPAWVSVRNVSDPQMNGSLPLNDQKAQAAAIYEQYGYWTSVCSAIVCWAIIAG